MRECGNEDVRNGLGRQLLPEAVSFRIPAFPHIRIPASVYVR